MQSQEEGRKRKNQEAAESQTQGRKTGQILAKCYWNEGQLTSSTQISQDRLGCHTQLQ